ncbi:hypothetical protein [Niveispirillum fermenti]|uniref:hypothetical protein n=1 Tax=Niveispirillum fermenti TaxID=1233113 RepID=UPI0040414A46
MRFIGLVAMSVLTLAVACHRGSAQAPGDPVSLSDQRPRIEGLLRDLAAVLLADPILLDGVRSASAGNDDWPPALIAERDNQWRLQAKRGVGPLLDQVLGGPLSRQLVLLRLPLAGLLADLALMDDRGLLIAATRLTSDYDQSDEPKFMETLPAGPGAILVEPPAYDELADDYVIAASITLTDPWTGRPIGVLTANIALDTLDR